MGSTRLPGKVLKEVMGKPLLLHLIDRLKYSKYIEEIIIATTTNKQDDIIVRLAEENSIKYYRGSESDVLDRYYKTAEKFQVDPIVHITSDCPLIDPEVTDKVIKFYLNNKEKYDFVSNMHPPSFPDGLDTNVYSFKALKEAWENANEPFQREHVTPYIWDNPDKFRIGNIKNDIDYSMKKRWTLDYEEDYQFIKAIYENLYPQKKLFTMNDVLSFLKKRPVIEKINSHLAGLYWYKNVEGKLKTMHRSQYKRDKPLELKKSLELLKKAKEVIPCATQTLSKGYTQWSVGACPLFIQSAKGCEVTDVDGNVYIDFGMALGPFSLGYSDQDVNKAVAEQLEKGTMFTLPHPLEAQAAELIIENVPCAEMVRFGKNGSDATSAAVKLARAYTGKEKIITCGYHGWQDWYIASTERDAGIPKFLKDLVIPMKYNDLNSLKRILAENKGEIACLIMEPMAAVPPENNFLEEVKRITEENGIVLIFDELFTGFRWSIGGAQKYFNVIPDLACFGKAMANGFPISCVAGKREIMEKFEEVFFSFTYGGETLSLAATIATINKLKTRDVYEHVEKLGTYLIDNVKKLVVKHDLSDYVTIMGFPFKSVFLFKGNESIGPLEIKTFFQQECAKRGILFIGYHLISYSHKKRDIDFTLDVYDEVMCLFKEVIDKNTLKESLKGTVVTQIFKNVGDRSVM